MDQLEMYNRLQILNNNLDSFKELDYKKLFGVNSHRLTMFRVNRYYQELVEIGEILGNGMYCVALEKHAEYVVEKYFRVFDSYLDCLVPKTI
ncbi:hypothetical protein KY330_00095 [Candidatus Woesearchaeota archaeon]|nr:hypothetical protein [Candidatus Woesearchaeota archaeon]